MAKETFYFSHDYSGRNDPKLQKVLMKLGQAGKGVFWDLIEMLYEQDGYLLLSEIESYAFALRTDCETINRLINEFDLFKKNDINFWSNSVLQRLDRRDEKSKSASKSAKTRWDRANALKTDTNALQDEYDSNAIKKSKVNKNKEKKSKVNNGIDFEFFWIDYDKKVGDKEKIRKKWDSLDEDTQNKILNFIPKYKISQPDKAFRKNPETFLNNKSWLDELIFKQNGKQSTATDRQRGRDELGKAAERVLDATGFNFNINPNIK